MPGVFELKIENGKLTIEVTIQSRSINGDLSGRGTNLSAPSGHLPLKGEARYPGGDLYIVIEHLPLKGEARLKPTGVAFLAPPLGELARSA